MKYLTRFLVQVLFVALFSALNFGVGFAISHLTGFDFGFSLGICSFLMGGLFLIYWLKKLFDEMRSRGDVIVNIGFIKDRDGFIFGCFLFLLMDLILNFGDWSLARTFRMGGHFYLITVAFFLWVVANSSLKITQNGIWVYTGLIRWHDIYSFYWEGDSKLIIKTKGKWFEKFSMTHLHLNNADQKVGVDSILQQKCPVTNSGLEIR